MLWSVVALSFGTPALGADDDETAGKGKLLLLPSELFTAPGFASSLDVVGSEGTTP